MMNYLVLQGFFLFNNKLKRNIKAVKKIAVTNKKTIPSLEGLFLFTSSSNPQPAAIEDS